jgi:hypothetical protein
MAGQIQVDLPEMSFRTLLKSFRSLAIPSAGDVSTNRYDASCVADSAAI